jgi:hypothetical protein
VVVHADINSVSRRSDPSSPASREARVKRVNSRANAILRPPIVTVTEKTGDTLSEVAAAHGLTLAACPRAHHPQPGEPSVVRDGYLRGSLPRTPTARQIDVLAAFVAAGGSVADAAARVGVRPSTAKRHLADLRARSGLTTEQLIYRGRAEGWLAVPSLEPA